MRNIFDSLIKMQEIDRKLKKLESVRGDLPQRLEALSNELQATQALLQEKEAAINEMNSLQQSCHDEVVVMKEKLKKYQSQLFQVKTNREYDAITVEIENTEKEIDALEFKTLENDEVLAKMRGESEALTPRIEEMQKAQAENRDILEKTLAVTRDEEAELQRQRETVSAGLTKPILSTYDRIRIGRGGMALALLKDGACSECSSRIPPQRGLEIRQMEKLYLCEVCGRIMIWSPETEKLYDPK